MQTQRLGVVQRELLLWLFKRTCEIDRILAGQVGFVGMSGRSRRDNRIYIHYHNVGWSRSEAAKLLTKKEHGFC